MFLTGHARQFSSRADSRASARGFTLVEILVVVVIISMLAMMAVPGIQIVQRRARSSAVINDFRVFATAFETYAHEKGTYPPDSSAPGVLPVGMETMLKPDSWQRVTPIGGHYSWETDSTQSGTVYKAVLRIVGTTDAPLLLDVNQLTDIDKNIDNGDIYTGSFLLGFGLSPVFVVEK